MDFFGLSNWNLRGILFCEDTENKGEKYHEKNQNWYCRLRKYRPGC